MDAFEALKAAYFEKIGSTPDSAADGILTEIACFAESDDAKPAETAHDMEWLADVLVAAANKLLVPGV